MSSTRVGAVRSFEAIGTTWTIETAEPLSAQASAEVDAMIASFDRTWSRFRDDSVVAGLARTAGAITAPADAVDMLELYAALDDATAGAVNPLVGDSLARLGYDARVRLVAGEPVPAPDWRSMLQWHGGVLALSEPATLDVGALGKGRLVDLVLEVVLRHLPAGAPGDVVVDASGDLAVRGAPQRVGLEHPFRPGQAIGVIELADRALCASATNRRSWGDGLHHVLDARTGMPVRAYAATWAVADTAMEADALATALFFDGGPQLAAERGVEWVRMGTDGRVEWSPASTAELFS